MKKRFLPLLLLTLCLTISFALAEGKFICPSEVESTLVDGRDFYVIAEVPEDATSATVRLIDESGEAVRVLTGTNAPQFYLEYEGLNAFNTDQAEYFMPDLIYLPNVPDSLYDGSIKCYVKNGLLFAVIPGGYYKMDGHDIVDAEGNAYAPLVAGDYTLEVSAGEATFSMPLTLGASDVKIMARFSPDGHFANVTAAADEGEFRTYLDSFPGYWSPSSFIPGHEGNPYFAEIKDRWQLADGMEYAAGTVHFYIYNVSPGSATNAVELAILQLDNAVDTRMRAYYYETGEPLLPYADERGEIFLTSGFVPFEAGDKLVYTRAEITENAEDNYYLAYSEENRPIDLDVYDGMSVPAGQALTLFGVACPIQNDAADLTQTGGAAWEIGNRIAQIEYAFACDDDTWTETRDVGLTRMLDVNWEGYSLYEFAHAFVFDEAHAGESITVSAQGIDAHGKPVAGAAEALTILVE